MKNVLTLVLMFSSVSLAAQPRIPFKEIALAGTTIAADVLDVEATQSCLHRHTCYEANPLAPTSRVRVYPLSISFDLSTLLYAHHQRVTGHRFWYLAPVITSLIHTGAGSFNLTH